MLSLIQSLKAETRVNTDGFLSLMQPWGPKLTIPWTSQVVLAPAAAQANGPPESPCRRAGEGMQQRFTALARRGTGAHLILTATINHLFRLVKIYIFRTPGRFSFETVRDVHFFEFGNQWIDVVCFKLWGSLMRVNWCCTGCTVPGCTAYRARYTTTTMPGSPFHHAKENHNCVCNASENHQISILKRNFFYKANVSIEFYEAQPWVVFLRYFLIFPVSVCLLAWLLIRANKSCSRVLLSNYVCKPGSHLQSRLTGH